MSILTELDRPAAPEEVAPRGPSVRGTTPPLVAPHRESADNDAAWDDAAIPAHDVEPWARHASAANGFGDVAAAARSASYERYLAARGLRAFVVGELIAAAIRAVRAIARQAYARYQQRRVARTTYQALDELDDHALRDLGFARSELASVAAEAAGEAESTRLRVLWASRALP